MGPGIFIRIIYSSPGLSPIGLESWPNERARNRLTPLETAALVDAYLWMWMNDRAQRTFIKAHLVRSLMAGPVSGRSRPSIEYKFRNVSKVFEDLKLPYVDGYVPADNASDDIREVVQLAFGRLASRLEANSPRLWG